MAFIKLVVKIITLCTLDKLDEILSQESMNISEAGKI